MSDDLTSKLLSDAPLSADDRRLLAERLAAAGM